jgi:hypothetical protein
VDWGCPVLPVASPGRGVAINDGRIRIPIAVALVVRSLRARIVGYENIHAAATSKKLVRYLMGRDVANSPPYRLNQIMVLGRAVVGLRNGPTLDLKRNSRPVQPG